MLCSVKSVGRIQMVRSTNGSRSRDWGNRHTLYINLSKTHLFYYISQSPYTPSLLTLICVYGYSLAIYIPVSILWVIQLSLLQWLLVITATFLSGSVLVLVLTPALRVSRVSLILAAAIVGAHFLLATGFMLYFFHVPESLTATVVSPVASNQTKWVICGWYNCKYNLLYMWTFFLVWYLIDAINLFITKMLNFYVKFGCSSEGLIPWSTFLGVSITLNVERFRDSYLISICYKEFK